MTTLNNVNGINIDLENGFAYAHTNDEYENLFQVCLVRHADGEFIAAVDSKDSGWDDGMCGDWNSSIGATEETFHEFLKIAPSFGLEVK